MHQLTIRVTDPQYESLRRILTHEKAERGARYSMSDLCARLLMLQLSRSAVSVPQLDAPSPLGDGTVHIVRGPEATKWYAPPPPPVPKLEPTIWPPAAAPQPERLARPSEGGSDVESSLATVPVTEEESSDSLEQKSVLEIERMSGEGGSDGHLGN